MIRPTAFWLAAGVVLIAAGLSAGRAASAAAASADAEGASAYVLDARVVGDENRVRFIADLSKPVDAAVFTLADPYRIVIDMPEVQLRAARGRRASRAGA